MTKRALCVLGLVVASASAVGCVAGSSDEADAGVADEGAVGTVDEAMTVGDKNFVCAQSLTLRSSPGGASIGTMYSFLNGKSFFTVQSTSGSWAYGYSHDLHKWGWAMNHYLTTEYWTSGPYSTCSYEVWCKQGGQWIGGGNGCN